MKYNGKANSCSFKMNIHKSKYMLYYYSSSFQKKTVTCKYCKIFKFFLRKFLWKAVMRIIMNNNFNNYYIVATQQLTKMHICFRSMTALNQQFMSDFE